MSAGGALRAEAPCPARVRGSSLVLHRNSRSKPRDRLPPGPGDSTSLEGQGGAEEQDEGAQTGRERERGWKVSGRGLAHVETNYGEGFPSGWIYVQVRQHA